jgi:ribonuclease HI
MNRVLSFTDGFVEGTLEDCSTEITGMVSGIVSAKDLVHKVKSARAKQRHEQWIRSLPDLTMIVYTDGSRQFSGDVGCGWAIYCVGDGIQRLIASDFCYLGNRAEVFDAELHAVQEGLLALGEIDTPPGLTYLCIDNTAAIDTLSCNNRNSMYAREALQCAGKLSEKGWSFKSVWTPSHCSIEGNEAADCLANKGAQIERADAKCKSACTTKAWLQAEARRRFYRKWQTVIPNAQVDMRAPKHFDSLSWRECRAVFKIFAGRTPSDPYQGEEKIPCDCGASDISSQHLLMECPQLDEPRKRLVERLPAEITLTPSLAIQKQFTAHFVRFIRETGLGARATIKLNQNAPDSVADSDQEELEVDLEFPQEEGPPFGAFE